jgi:hypothetical protein
MATAPSAPKVLSVHEKPLQPARHLAQAVKGADLGRRLDYGPDTEALLADPNPFALVTAAHLLTPPARKPAHPPLWPAVDRDAVRAGGRGRCDRLRDGSAWSPPIDTFTRMQKSA